MSDEPTTPAAPADAKPEAPANEAAAKDEKPAATPEEVEAFWKNRQSNSDKAHAAEAAALREQISSLTGAAKSAPTTGQSADSTAIVEGLQKQLAEEKQLRVVDTRAAKFPNAAKALGDDTVLAQMDEGRLASLNESLSPTAPPRFDTNNPARQMAAGTKPLDQMTTDELKAHLRTIPVPTNEPS